MSDHMPFVAGWYPDPNTNGTRYWDGNAWTGATRPQRKRFAAVANYGFQPHYFALSIGGGLGLMLLGGGESTGVRVAGIASIVAAATISIYFLRGRGPTTAEVSRHLASQRGVEDAEMGAEEHPRLRAMPFFALAGLVVGAAASGRDDDGDYTYLPVPAGLARKWWSIDRLDPVLAMRVKGAEKVEVTFDGTIWEDARRVNGDWVVPEGGTFPP